MTMNALEIVLEVPMEKNVVRTLRLGRIEIRGALGPSDFPERLRVSVKKDTPGRITLDFLYAMLSEEETVIRPGQNGTVVHVGKHTGRVMRIESPVPMNLSPGVVQLNISPTLRELEASSKKNESARTPRQLAHYSMISDLMPWVSTSLSGKVHALQ